MVKPAGSLSEVKGQRHKPSCEDRWIKEEQREEGFLESRRLTDSKHIVHWLRKCQKHFSGFNHISHEESTQVNSGGI